jgi:hypothetical protein
MKRLVSVTYNKKNGTITLPEKPLEWLIIR